MKTCWRINCDKARKDSKFHKASIFCEINKEIEWVEICNECNEKSASDMSHLAGMKLYSYYRSIGKFKDEMEIAK